ncbi:DNA topoisomerase (ATP-hydrolyzing) subunit B [Sulfurovum sp.]|jgi:DNA gyrase subunit B|uniref:DNA topoisomerase (ATP-hydrolyzing) subunit B n=1 Tax=Sulfurovum sp. TaxID=1969726 RepID=UPI002A363E15|nr:DNA topoisomerase (ATP-hydrolyzing) subunit B [Sulfurovum sp.]MDD3499992.1 DNA topoisomerase (ATP-hydrolyzing) subunit B [Sulfurovum sp.]MDY0402662.1 DNA topoisomerase (ATP-hydrolyzing) subunit B [Sulfurovum sp.]
MAEYGASNIKVLKGLEAVRKRPGMYIGDTSEKGLHHLVYEVVDNSIDEAMAGYCDTIKVTLTKEGSAIIEDNGRGIPVTEHPTEKISAATVVLTVLHAGGKFDKDTYKVSGGLHGVGVSVVNALSKKLDMTIFKDGQIHTQSFQKGIPDAPLESGDATRKHGTKIEFWPDETIFTESVKFKKEILMKRFKELCYLNPKITIDFRDERDGSKELFHFEGGIRQFVEDMNTKEPLSSAQFFSGSAEDAEGGTVEIDIAMMYCNSDTEKVLSFVNNIKTPDGGTHEAGFRAGLTRSLASYITKNANAKEKNTKITGDDCKEGLIAIVSVRVPEPQFEGQTKGKLGSSYVRPLVQKLFSENFNKYLEETPIEAKAIMEQVLLAARGRDAAKRAKELVKRKDSMSVGTLPGKLADCQSKDPEISEIYLVEGDSAGGSAKQGRDRVFQAILPLKGKILNVEKARLDKILKSDEIKNMITALGCGIGDEFDEEKLRYHKIIIMTDADVDGSHIQTLLMTFFFRFLRPVIEKGYLYLAQPPLYRYKKGKNEMYLKDDVELNNFLIGNGISAIESQTMGENDLIDLFKLVGHYKMTLKDLENRFALPEVVRYMIENPDIIATSNEALFKTIEAYIYDLGYNILNQSVTEEQIHLYVQTNDGLEELIIDDILFTNPQYNSAIEIHKRIQDHITEEFADKDLLELFEVIESSAKKGAYIQRYKGLGEMNPEQLWETTMTPENRKLLQVKIDDLETASETFTLFMGDEVEPRRNYIETHAKDVKNLDV